MLEIKILTAYPEIFPGALGHSILGKALEEKKWSLDIVNLHDFGIDERKNIDDEPFGGGPGMVIRADVVENALLSIDYPKDLKRLLIYLTPSGRPLKQSNLLEFIEFNQLIILCGRFEGVDARVIDSLGFKEISIGDYVLAGGEVAAQVLVEGCVRLLPGVLGRSESILEESFSKNLLEYPQYTKPHKWEKKEVPDLLLSGDHAKIKHWRLTQSEDITRRRRPDLWEKYKKNK